MAKKIYDEDITKNVDWGGDSSTGGLPVSGRSVQKFIKTTFESKIGYIHEDREHNQCLGFADQDDYELYITDPEEHADLLIQSWYSYFPPAPVVLENPAYYGATNDEILISSAALNVLGLTRTTSLSNVCPSNKPYVYIALYEGYRFIKAITINNEDILSEFVDKGSFVLNDLNYKLYEFHLSSGLSLDVNINISFSKN